MIEQLRIEVDRLRRNRKRAQRLWSFAHHLSTFGTAILSLIVATLSQVKQLALFDVFAKDNLIAFLSLTAAIFATVAARGRFEPKWIRNRLSRSDLDLLYYDLLDEDVDVADAKERLKTIVKQHDIGIIGQNDKKPQDDNI